MKLFCLFNNICKSLHLSYSKISKQYLYILYLGLVVPRPESLSPPSISVNFDGTGPGNFDGTGLVVCEW